MKMCLLPIVAVLLVGCTDIPEQTITLDADLSAKLSKVQSVHLIPNPKLFTTIATYREHLGPFYFEVLDVLQTMGAPEQVRIVFAFSS